MKFLTALLAFYILFLPILPCADSNEGNGQQATVISTSHKDSHQDNDEACNPFCNCSCCGQVFTAAFLPGKIVFIKPVSQEHSYFYCDSNFSSRYLGNIWQPPKLS